MIKILKLFVCVHDVLSWFTGVVLVGEAFPLDKVLELSSDLA